MKREDRGCYYRSERAYTLATGRKVDTEHSPSIHVSGSVRGMRKLFWGYKCDVVRVGQWIYKVT